MLGPAAESWQRVVSMSSWLVPVIATFTISTIAIHGRPLKVSRKLVVIVPRASRCLLGHGLPRRLCSRRGCRALADYLGIAD
jgi:hypothetical protein